MTNDVRLSVARPLKIKFARFSKVVSIVGVLVGSLVLVGWALDIAAVQSIIPGAVTMKANTALTFLLCGVSLWLQANDPADDRFRRAGLVCAGLAALMGLLNLSQHLFGWNLGIDQFLFREAVGAAGTSNAGRMAPTTAFSFLAMGTALLLLGTRYHGSVAVRQYLALTVAVISLLAFVGYAYGAAGLLGPAAYTQMAVHTAVTFLLLSGGVLAARPDEGLMATFTSEGIGGLTARRLSWAIFGIPLVLGYLFHAGESRGSYDSAFALSLLVVSTVVVLSVVIWRNARSFELVDDRRHEAEMRTVELNQDLERRVSVRTAQLEVANQELVNEIAERKQAEEALRESEGRLRQSQRLEAVGSLAGGIAHDFNNLLTVIIGQTEFLRGTPHTSDERRAGLDEIRTVADRAAALTRQLLAFSRRQALQPQVLNVNDVAESMTGLLKRVLGEDIGLVFREDPTLWPVEADPCQLEQVIMNLAVNARDAMPQGGKLMIETANVEVDETYAAGHLGTQAGPYVLLAVSDTGRGMDGETLCRVFEPFFTTKEPGKGTGLGLSTVYGIVKQSGGNIWVYSEPGQGTTFKVYLPRADKPIDWTPEGEPARKQRIEGGTETILVVEDEPALRTLAVRILQGAGYTVLHEGAPAEALKLYDEYERSVDLLLTDVVLQGMSGKVLAETLEAKQRVSPRVLFMSGYTRNAIVHDGRLDPGVNFLEKPFTPAALLRKVREVLDRPYDGQLGLPI